MQAVVSDFYPTAIGFLLRFDRYANRRLDDAMMTAKEIRNALENSYSDMTESELNIAQSRSAHPQGSEKAGMEERFLAEYAKGRG